jgi:hypothetical protein
MSSAELNTAGYRHINERAIMNYSDDWMYVNYVNIDDTWMRVAAIEAVRPTATGSIIILSNGSTITTGKTPDDVMRKIDQGVRLSR